MVEDLDRLGLTLKPPTAPSEAPDQRRWHLVQEALGIVLPNDYREFLELYGTGRIGNFLWIFNPFSGNPHLNLITQRDVRLDAHRAFRSKFPKAVPFALFPEANGLFPFGATENGDVMFWGTAGGFIANHIILYDGRCDGFERFSCSTVGFLLEVFEGRISSDILPADLAARGRHFHPWRPPTS